MSSEVQGSLWEIYQDIGRSDASAEMSDTQKAQLVTNLREVADKLETQLKVKTSTSVPVNELSEITYQGNTYTLIDDTEFGPNEMANSIYRFINCADPSIIDASCVHEVMVSAESFSTSIAEFHHTYRVQYGVPHTVEFIGNDLRAKSADPDLICK